MILRVIKKQKNSKMCFVCGIENDASMHTNFYELENNYILGVCNPKNIHQSYPNRMHGGLITSLLDETVGRAIQISEEIWGVTSELTVRFLKPVPLNEEIYSIGYITEENKRMFYGSGYLMTKNKVILAECDAKYVKLPLNKISENELNGEWFYIAEEEMIKEIDIPR